MDISRRTFLGTSAALGMAASARGENGAPKKLRACVIADTERGGWGHHLHRVWNVHDDVEVVGYADHVEPMGRMGAKHAEAARFYTDYREMLDKERPDLVTVCPRWSIRHREFVCAAAEIGAHGFCEKPLAVDLVEADAMMAAIEAKDLKWGIAFNFRATPWVELARKLVIEEGLIGDVLELRARGKEDHRAGGEDMLVLGTHLFDLMRYFAGDAVWCRAHVLQDGRPARLEDRRMPSEGIGPVLGDEIHATFGFSSGIVGYFASVKSPVTDSGRWGVDLYGTKGIVLIRLAGPGVPTIRVLRDPAWLPGVDDKRWERLPGAPDPATYDNANRYRPITASILEAIGNGGTPNVSLADGRASLEMILAVYKAHFAGGPVSFPLEPRTHPLAD